MFIVISPWAKFFSSCHKARVLIICPGIMSMELTWSSYASYRIPGCTSYSKLQDNDHKQANVAKKKAPPDDLQFSHATPVFLSVSDDHVLTQNEVAHYLELSERGDNTR